MLSYSKLLTEICDYEHYNGVNEYNEKDYKAPILLRCFTSFDFSNDRNLYNQDLVLKKKVFIENTFEPNPLDRIDGMEIQVIKPVKSLLSGIIGWEIIL